jgi:bla regulator protein BlaR1
LKVCEFCVGSPLACVSGVTGSDLKKRMVNIMTEQIARKLDFGRKLLLSTAGVLALALPIVFGLANATQIRAQAQDESSTPSYTASVKAGELAKPTSPGGAVRRVGMMYSPDGFSAMNVTLQALIQEAYGVEANQIIGPADLLASAAYDVDVKVGKSADNNADPELHAKEAQRALRAVLEDRFQLKIHRENEQISTYALEVADGGSRLQLAKPASSYPDAIKGPNGRLLESSVRLKLDGGQVVGMEARGMSVPDFAQQLSRQFGAPVQDKTGIAGHYDFSLKWTRDASEPGADDGQATYPARSGAVPSLFTALQEQLGLKLEPQKAPMEILVIDHVAKPAEN